MPSLSAYPKNRYPRGLSHKVPLLLPGLLALAGATYPRAALKCVAAAGALASATLVVILILRFLRFIDGVRPYGSGRRTLRRHLCAVTPLVLCAACLIIGISRGFMWDGRLSAAREMARSGSSAHFIIPLEEPHPEPYGHRYSFRALAYSPDFGGAGSFGVQASAHSRDVSELIPGVPVLCRASIEVPSPAMNPGGFDYRRYLLGERVVALAGIERVSRLTEGWAEAPTGGPAGWLPLAVKVLAALKTRMAGAIDSTFPGEDAALLKAVFLGDRGELTPEDSRDFKRSGFYRFVGICGFHVDLFFGLIERNLRRLTKRHTLSRMTAVLVAFCYGCLSGWPAGVLRAFVSGSLRTFAPALRRRYHPLAGLGASALVVALAVPFPFTNTGFLLSFAGALGAWLGWVYTEAFGHVLKFADGVDIGHLIFRLGAMARRAATRLLRPLTMCLVLLPVMAFCFDEVSIVSFFLSGIWGSLAAFMLPVAAVTAFFPPLGALFGWVPHIFLRGVRAISRVAASAPMASVTLPSPGVLEIAACWALLAAPLTLEAIHGRVHVGEEAAVFFRLTRLRRVVQRVVVLGSTAILLILSFLRVYAVLPEVTFLYVGQGDCAVVRCGAAVMMVDTSTASAFERHVLPYLRAKGLHRIDLCVISHLHADHVGGLPVLCSEVTVGLVAVAPGFREDAEAMIAGSHNLPEGRMPQVVELRAGRRYLWNGVSLDVLLPEQGSYGDAEPENDSSVAFILNLGNMEVEFWGDSPASSISAAMETYRTVLLGGSGLPQRVVKVPHHGSPDAYVEELYSRTKGTLFEGGQAMEVISIISVGPNSYGHPSKLVEEAANKGGKMLRLDETGAVTVRAAFGRVMTSTFLCGQAGIE